VTASSPFSKNNRDLIFLVVLFAIGLTVFELWLATTKHDNSRDQHLGTAVVYARGHIDLMRPVILGYNANGAPTPLEFPIWQAVTAIFMKAFGIWYGWGNVTSLLFFFGSLWALFDLCRRENSERAGWWAVFFSLIQPLSLVCGGQAAADGAAWAFAMWFIYSAYRMMNEGKWRWWFLAVLVGSLGAMTKAPFFMTAGLTTFFWLCLRHRTSVRAWAFLASSGVISTLFFLAWNYHCHKVYKEAEYPYWELDTFGGIHTKIYKWYLGSMAYRLNMHTWKRLGWHLYNMVFDGSALAFLVIASVWFRRSLAAWVWLLAAAMTTEVFPILIVEHSHYLFIFAPAVAWLCAVAAVELEPGIWNLLKAATTTRCIILLSTFLCSLPGLCMLMRATLPDSYNQEIADLIEQHTSPDEKIIVWGQIWGSPFLRAHRDGLTGGAGFTTAGWLDDDPQKLERLKQLGFRKIVVIKPSPFTVAVTEASGGEIETPDDLHKVLPPKARNWPVAFETPQLLIVQIPQ